MGITVYSLLWVMQDIYICLFKHIYIYHHRRQQPYYLEHENKLNSEDSWQEPWPRREFAKAALKPKLLNPRPANPKLRNSKPLNP